MTSVASGELVELGVALDRITSWTRRHSTDTAGGLSMSARYTLGRLCDDGAHRLSELARLEGVTQPAMSALVNRLEADGLVRRDSDPDDGRVALVSVTDTGRAFVARRRKDRARALAEHIAQLPPQQRGALVAALPALRNLTAP
jgi:DNA-binding MarR family transcriptional regulator